MVNRPRSHAYFIGQSAIDNFHELTLTLRRQAPRPPGARPPRQANPHQLPRLNFSAYLDLLATLNPTTEHWRDNRPDDLRQYDARQLATGKLPIWSDTFSPTDTAPMYLTLAPATITTFANLASVYGIGRHTIVNEAYRRSTPLLNHRTPHALAAYALRAYALQYLVPVNLPTADDLAELNPWYKPNGEGGY